MLYNQYRNRNDDNIIQSSALETDEWILAFAVPDSQAGRFPETRSIGVL